MPVVMLAHGLVEPGHVWSSWSWEPLVLAGLGTAAALYAVGATRSASAPRPTRVVSFYLGLVAIGGALVSPLDPFGETLFSAHMAQHMTLMLVAPPLLLYGRPVVVVMRALPRSGARPLYRLERRLRWLVAAPAAPILAWGVGTATLWLWHLPGPYEVALRTPALHVIEHISFLLVSMWFWGLVFRSAHGSPAAYGAAILLTFATALQSGALGAVLTFAAHPLYSVHDAGAAAWGLTPLEDQQLAGALMWIPGGIVYLATMTILFVRWFSALDRASLVSTEGRR